MEAKTITVSLKDFEFESVSKGVTVPIPIHTKEDLFETSVNILRGFKISKPIRLIGLRASQL